MLAGMRSAGVARRLGSVFAVVVLVFGAALVSAVAGVREGQGIDRSVRRMESLQQQLQAVHYYDADVCGWESFILLSAYDQGATEALDPKSENYAGLQASRRGLEQALAAVDVNALSPAERTTFAGVRQLWTRYWAADETFLDAIREGGPQGLRAANQQLNGPSADIYQELIDLNDTLARSVAHRVQAAHTSAHRTADATVARSVLAAVAAVVIGSLLLAAVTRRITVPLRTCRDALHSLAAKDLTVEVDAVRDRGEVADIASAVAVLRDTLRAQVASIQTVAQDLNSQSSALGASSSTAQHVAALLAQETSAAASSATEVSATVDAMAASGQQVQAGIEAVSRSTRESADVATEAVQIMAVGETAVAGLVDAAENIATVVNLISTIAEQTKLLALNATIEAARAGHTGQGFAVVAAEVKDLAEETARATTQITDRVAALHEGGRGVSQALTGIGAVIERINTLQAGIATSVAEQADGVDALTSGICAAAVGVGKMATSLGAIATDADAGARASDAAQSAADVLVADAEQLAATVSGFRTDRHRAATAEPAG